MSDESPSSPPEENSHLAEPTRPEDEIPELEGVLEEIEPEELKSEIRAVLERYSGPLPHPSILEGYKEVDPRSLDWVINSASREQEHRHWCDKEPLRQSGRAQWFAFTIAVLVILVGGGLIYTDKSAAGLATILVPLATLLGIFVYREIRSSKEAQLDEGRDKGDN
jgi:uncharacterized membrane protein